MRLIKLLILCLFISACSIQPDTPPTTKVVNLNKVIVHPLLPPKVLAPDVKFEVVIQEETNVYFGLTEPEYLKMSKWLQQVTAHIKEQKAIILYYRKIITEQNAQNQTQVEEKLKLQ